MIGEVGDRGDGESFCPRSPAPPIPHSGLYYRASVQVASGLYSCIALAISAVRGPRSFWYTLPWWLTRNVMTPVFPYSAGKATRAKPAIMLPLITKLYRPPGTWAPWRV